MSSNELNVYDVNFNVYSSITVKARSREEALDQLTDEDYIERLIESVKGGGLDIGTIELLEGSEDEDEEDIDEDEIEW